MMILECGCQPKLITLYNSVYVQGMVYANVLGFMGADACRTINSCDLFCFF
jgi:hypothetical protein